MGTLTIRGVDVHAVTQLKKPARDSHSSMNKFGDYKLVTDRCKASRKIDAELWK